MLGFNEWMKEQMDQCVHSLKAKTVDNGEDDHKREVFDQMGDIRYEE